MPEWDDDEDDDNSNLVKDLRKQLKAAKDARAEIEKELSTLRPQVRSNSLKGVLSELGVNPKIAALLPSDLETNKDAVSKWLDEYGDVFNLKVAEPAASAAVEKPAEQQGATGSTAITPELIAQWQRMQAGEAAQGTTTPDIETQQVARLGQAAAASGGSFDSFVALLRGEKPLPS